MTDTAAGRLGRGGAAEARAGVALSERGAARLPPPRPAPPTPPVALSTAWTATGGDTFPCPLTPGGQG